MSKTFKYFYLFDSNREAVGKVKAVNLHEAYVKASYIKKLGTPDFKKIFSVQEIDE